MKSEITAKELVMEYASDCLAPFGNCPLDKYKRMSITKRKKELDKLTEIECTHLVVQHLSCEWKKKHKDD